jgi:hypothetical protein
MSEKPAADDRRECMQEAQPRIVKWPTDEETKAAFEAYTLALGKVAHAWNYLHEKLGQLFVVISGADRNIALAIWYSTDSDRVQRGMLRAAVAATSGDRWNALPKAHEHLKWLLDRADEVAEQRNNAIHAPCSLYIGGGEAGSAEMGASFFHGHPRARKLQGKKVLIEFDWCERYAETLSVFTQKLETAIAFPERYPWPEKPLKPTRKAKI